MLLLPKGSDCATLFIQELEKSRSYLISFEIGSKRLRSQLIFHFSVVQGHIHFSFCLYQQNPSQDITLIFSAKSVESSHPRLCSSDSIQPKRTRKYRFVAASHKPWCCACRLIIMLLWPSKEDECSPSPGWFALSHVPLLIS